MLLLLLMPTLLHPTCVSGTELPAQIGPNQIIFSKTKRLELQGKLMPTTIIVSGRRLTNLPAAVAATCCSQSAKIAAAAAAAENKPGYLRLGSCSLNTLQR